MVTVQRRGVVIVGGLVAFLAASGCTSSDNSIAAPSAQAADTKAAETSDPAGPEPYVRVNVTDLVGLKDGGLAGVLYATDGERLTEDLAVGGFGVAVDADPFTTSQVVSAPSSVEATGALFPDVTGVPLAVEPGPYTLVLWADATPLGWYGRWIPGGGEYTGRARTCRVHFRTTEPSGATVTVAGMPEGTEWTAECPSWTLGVPVQ